MGTFEKKKSFFFEIVWNDFFLLKKKGKILDKKSLLSFLNVSFLFSSCFDLLKWPKQILWLRQNFGNSLLKGFWCSTKDNQSSLVVDTTFFFVFGIFENEKMSKSTVLALTLSTKFRHHYKTMRSFFLFLVQRFILHGGEKIRKTWDFSVFFCC